MSMNKKEIKNKLDEIINVIETGKNENNTSVLDTVYRMVYNLKEEVCKK